MGIVFRARRCDGEFQREVAIKLVTGKILEIEAERRFITERRILALLSHPNIVGLIDGGIWEGQRYLVMELVDGMPITDYAEQKKLGLEARLRLFQQVCGAIEYAHQQLVIHRDLKPANLLVTRDGVVKVLDFGIARLMDSIGDEARGTALPLLSLRSASPEQLEGGALGTATDTYSLGVLLFQLLTGRLPYGAAEQNAGELVRAIVSEEPVWEPAGMIRPELRHILEQALQKKPSERYASVAAFSADIACYLEARPVSARRGGILYRGAKFVRRQRIPLAVAALLAVAVGAGAYTTMRESRRAAHRFDQVRSLARYVLFDSYDAIANLPGSLSARRMLVERAQQYLDSLREDAPGDLELSLDLANSYTRLGEIQGFPYRPNLGDSAGAMRSFVRAIELLDRELTRHPGNRAIEEKLADANFARSVLLMRQGKNEEGIEIARRTVALRESLRQQFPQEPPRYFDLAIAHGALGQNLMKACEEKTGLRCVRRPGGVPQGAGGAT